MRKDFWYATSVLIGAIVGVGLFGIPYVSVKSGFWIGSAYIVVLALAVLLVHLLYGEIEERTEGRHRLTGYAERYLGKWGKWIVGATVFIGAYGALVAYLVIAGEFLDIVLPGVANPYMWTIVFWIVGSLAIWR